MGRRTVIHWDVAPSGQVSYTLQKCIGCEKLLSFQREDCQLATKLLFAVCASKQPQGIQSCHRIAPPYFSLLLNPGCDVNAQAPSSHKNPITVHFLSSHVRVAIPDPDAPVCGCPLMLFGFHSLPYVLSCRADVTEKPTKMDLLFLLTQLKQCGEGRSGGESHSRGNVCNGAHGIEREGEAAFQSRHHKQCRSVNN